MDKERNKKEEPSKNIKNPHYYDALIKRYLRSLESISKSIIYPNEVESIVKKWVEVSKIADEASLQLVRTRIIENTESLRSFLNVTNAFKNLNLESQLKLPDIALSISKSIKENTAILASITLPYTNLYKNILSNLDEETIENMASIIDNSETYDAVDDKEVDSDTNFIKRPYAFDTAFKINMYITITNDYVENSPNVKEEEKSLWRNKVLPVLLFLVQFLMSWATGDTPFSEMEGVKAINNIVETILEYDEPIEIEEKDNEE